MFRLLCYLMFHFCFLNLELNAILFCNISVDKESDVCEHESTIRTDKWNNLKKVDVQFADD